ncbi:MAG: serine hydrolase [Saprospiraceae bacterium]|nr:serine hydrolase [Saprospiraceae bacterium]
MRKIQIIFTITLFTFNFDSVAQNLESHFNVISANNDMMGGSLVVFCENGIIENLAIGKSDYSRNIDMKVDSKYRIASISKAITAIAVMQLAEHNLLNLDENISSILGYSVLNPNNPSVAITSRMLLSHTSTIIDGSTYSNFIEATVNNNPIPNLSEILTPNGAYYTTGQFNNAVPGTYFNYANINYVILGTIVEKVSNVRFDVYCKQNISDPLGIDASFNVNDLSDIDQLAVLYRKTNGVWIAQVDNYLGIQPVFNNLSGYITGSNGGRFGPQGGFRCSAQDLSKIFLVLMNKGSFNGVTLLSESSCNAMFTNEWTFTGNNGNNYYGLFRSWGLGIHRITSTPGNDIVLSGSTSMLGHAGEAYGLVSDAYFDTIRKVGVVFINNGVGIGYQTNNTSIFYTVEQQVFNAVENHGNISNCLQAVGINSIDIPVASLYPNPSSGFINIPGCSAQRGCKIKIVALDGRKVKSFRLDKGETRIDIQDLKRGMYILELNGTSYSFIKE